MVGTLVDLLLGPELLGKRVHFVGDDWPKWALLVFQKKRCLLLMGGPEVFSWRLFFLHSDETIMHGQGTFGDIALAVNFWTKWERREMV